jgi:hypothetical protein
MLSASLDKSKVEEELNAEMGEGTNQLKIITPLKQRCQCPEH